MFIYSLNTLPNSVSSLKCPSISNSNNYYKQLVSTEGKPETDQIGTGNPIPTTFIVLNLLSFSVDSY